MPGSEAPVIPTFSLVSSVAGRGFRRHERRRRAASLITGEASRRRRRVADADWALFGRAGLPPLAISDETTLYREQSPARRIFLQNEKIASPRRCHFAMPQPVAQRHSCAFDAYHASSGAASRRAALFEPAAYFRGV